MSKFIAAAALVLGLGAAAFWFSANTGSQTTLAPLSPISSAEAQEVDTTRVLEMTLGDADAPVTVIEYASFTCPHCASFHQDQFKQIKENYVDAGKVQFVYREVYFDRYGLWAGMLARCAGPERYFGLTELIYDQQADWSRAGEPADVAAALRRLGLSAGLNGDQIDACMQDGEMAQAMVAVYQANAEADNVRATPSFIIDGRPYSNMSYEDFAEILDGKLGE